jgi:hypothetical protein
MEAGQRAEALKHADAALALDPAFLAAQTLRERIVAMSPASVAAPVSSPNVALSAPAARLARPVPVAPAFAEDPAPHRPPTPDLTQFEARARQRRLEKRLAAAQQGLADGRLDDARGAIEEIRELDPFHPRLVSLIDALDAAERERLVAIVERELPLRPPVETVDLPLVLPPAPALTLGAPPVSDEPVAASPSEVLEEPLVVGTAEPPAASIPAPTIEPPREQRVAAAPLAAEQHPDAEAAAVPPRRSRVIPWLAAAAAFAGVVFATPWLLRSVRSDAVREPAPVEVAVIAPAVVPTTGADAAPIAPPPSGDTAAAPGDAVRPDPSAAGAAATAPPVPGTLPSDAAATSSAAPPASVDSALGRSVAGAPRPIPTLPVPEPADTLAAILPTVVPSSAPPQARTEPSPAVGISPDMPRQLAAAPIPAPPPPAAARMAPSPAAAAATITARPDDAQLVRNVLQQYRAAYHDLSAERARSIWPDVNAAALQRAFQALESQTLTFDACDVQLRGPSATATCRGTAEYVPKVGSREPRVEPRVWNFNLQKTGDAWQIESARTQR